MGKPRHQISSLTFLSCTLGLVFYEKHTEANNPCDPLEISSSFWMSEQVHRNAGLEQFCLTILASLP